MNQFTLEGERAVDPGSFDSNGGSARGINVAGVNDNGREVALRPGLVTEIAGGRILVVGAEPQVQKAVGGRIVGIEAANGEPG